MCAKNVEMCVLGRRWSVFSDSKANVNARQIFVGVGQGGLSKSLKKKDFFKCVLLSQNEKK